MSSSSQMRAFEFINILRYVNEITIELESRRRKLITLNLGYGEGIEGMLKEVPNAGYWWPLFKFKLPW